MSTEAPPSYEKSTIGAPPRYEEVFPVHEIQSEMYQAKTEGGQQAVRLPFKLCSLFCHSIACGILVLILSILPIIMIVVGSVYLDDCTLERMIPVFLIVFGVVSLFQTCGHLISMCAFRKKNDATDREHGRSGSSCGLSLISLFLFIWILVGSYYVFYNYNIWVFFGKQNCDDLNANPMQCCASEVMYTAFIVLLLIYVFGVVFFFVTCCCLLCLACLSLAE